MTKNILNSFLQMQMEYPEKDFQKGIQGTVKIEFLTDRYGNVLHREVLQNVSPGIDSAALSLFDLILWEPARFYGKAREGSGEFKIKYSTGKYERIVKKRGYDRICYPFKPVDDSGEIYSMKNLDKSPEAIIDSTFRSLNDYIRANLVFPEAAKKLSIEGEVQLKFVVETNGLPSNITVIQPIGGGCTEEAIRILETIKWMPGIRDGIAVRSCFYLNILFDANGELKNKFIPNQNTSGI